MIAVESQLAEFQMFDRRGQGASCPSVCKGSADSPHIYGVVRLLQDPVVVVSEPGLRWVDLDEHVCLRDGSIRQSTQASVSKSTTLPCHLIKLLDSEPRRLSQRHYLFNLPNLGNASVAESTPYRRPAGSRLLLETKELKFQNLVP